MKITAKIRGKDGKPENAKIREGRGPICQPMWRQTWGVTLIVFCLLAQLRNSL